MKKIWLSASALALGAGAFALGAGTMGNAHAAVVLDGQNIADPGFPALGDFVSIGDDGMGGGVGSLTINDGNVAQARSVNVGNPAAGIGTVMVDSGTLNLVHNPTNAFPIANLRVGGEGIGTLLATNGGQINFSNGDAFLSVGRFAGSIGRVELDASSLTMNVDPTNGTFASIQVARDGGAGQLLLRNGATITMRDPLGTPGTGPVSGESISIGRDIGSNGLISVDASTVSVEGTGAVIFVGRDGGTGELNVTNGSQLTVANTSGMGLDSGTITVGEGLGGTVGTFSVNQSDVTVDGAGGFAGIFVGRDAGSAGVAEFAGDQTDVIVTSAADTGVTVGRDAGANGILTVADGATLELTGGGVNRFDLGRTLGSTGTLNVLNGGKAIALTGADGDLFVGAAFSDFGRTEGGSGIVLIDGAGSEVRVIDNVLIGAIEGAGGGIGSGIVTVRNGGVLEATNVQVGSGGILQGDGTIEGNVIVDGGIVSPGNSPGTMTITGNFDLMMGTLLVEIAGLGPGEFDLFNVLGDVNLSGGMVEFQFTEGFAPMMGQTFDFFSALGTVNTAGTSFAFSGLEAGFAFDVQTDAMGNLNFTALSDGVATSLPSTPTPAPGALVLLAGGLLGVAWVRRRPAKG